MLDHYADFARKILIAYEPDATFYQHCGFELGTGKVPMSATYLKT